MATYFNKRKTIEAPEPPGAWPIIGHLLQLKSPQPYFRTLAAMADKHGSALTIRFGVHRTLLISSWESAKECFTTNDRALVGRPRSISSNHLSYDYALMASAPYGPYWRQVRQWVVHDLLSNRRFESLKHVQYAEIDNCVKDLYGLWVKNNQSQIKVEMNRLFRDLTLNIVLKIVMGKRYFNVVNVENEEENQRIQSIMIDFLKSLGVAVASDVLPSFLSWIDWDGKQRAMKRIAMEMDMLAKTWLQEHRQKRLAGKADSDDQQDFIDIMLSILEEDSQLYGHDHDSIVKATALVLIFAASEASALSLSWALCLLLNHKKVLAKAVDELDLCVGKSMEDCNLSGFSVPKERRVLVNVWKIHRDPRVWSNPLEFQPERILTTHVDIDVRGKSFELIPFGSGRRSCPGISFALQIMLMTLARLLHGFNLQTPSDQPVDMTEATGITLSKKNSLEVHISPRLPSHLYE
ncbi:hypothetical protein NE237_006805 [Protea cynaroides]|uniref:Cytochrome P450 n=1 Tax=Protea cynaroides TaxID=273540 RepID=A0A9Q0KN72_9MAGN|nr:hypothetical protein NE237_006805 [Protea cynaroides]